METEFNTCIENLTPSRSVEFMLQAKTLQAKDPSVISLAGGEPNFETPKPICDELIRWIGKGYTHYTVGPGLPELRERIAKKLREENGADYSANGIIVTPGGKFAIYAAVRALVNPGDRVMYPEPGWVSYPSIIEASGAECVPVRLDGKDDFRLTRKKLEEKYDDRVKVLIINYPNNPTGKVLSREEAEAVRGFMEAHKNVTLIADEIYERIVFRGFENISMASYPELRDRVVTVNGFSKSVAMTGWRIGYLAAPEKIEKVIYKLFQHTITCVSGFIQKAATVALDCTEEIEAMRLKYEERRDMFIDGLNAIPGVFALKPEGAFYAWVRFDLPGLDSEAVASRILNEAKIVGVPGIAYGTDESYVRFSFAASDEDLRETVKRIEKWMKEALQ